METNTNNNAEILEFFEKSEEFQEETIKPDQLVQGKITETPVAEVPAHSQNQKTISEDLYKQRQFFKRLCYEPVWSIDSITNPSELIYSAKLQSSFLLKIETGIHRIYQESIKDFINLKIFDLNKGVELKQITTVKHRKTFFGDIDEQRKFISFVDSLPLYFAIRPTCPRCNQPFDLINPMNRNDIPFWAHSTRLRSKNKDKSPTADVCRRTESLWGEFPNIDYRPKAKNKGINSEPNRANNPDSVVS